MKIEEIQEATFVELKDTAKELGIEKISGINKEKLFSLIKRKLNAIAKKKELVKQLKKTEKVSVQVWDDKGKEFKKEDWNMPKLPIFENKQVLSILKDGHNATHLHCEMEGGVRMHVPRKRLEGYGEGL